MAMKLNESIPVKIVMVTYNHERYIAQAIESVLLQKTDFKYKLVIGDDCSFDSTTDICIQYVNKFPDKIILVSNKKNLGLLANYKQLLDNYPAKYIAILEGDDYWTDVNKLQTQYNLLENNQDIGLVHTDCDLLFETGKLQSGCHQKHKRSIQRISVFEELLYKNYIRTATVMFRHELYDKYVSINEYDRLGFKTLDFPMWLDISKHTNFIYLNYSTSVYRIHGSSLSNSSQYKIMAQFYKSTYDIMSYVFGKYDTDVKLQESVLNKCMIARVSLEMKYKKYSTAQEMRKKIELINVKSFIFRLLASNRQLIDLYRFHLKLKGII